MYRFEGLSVHRCRSLRTRSNWQNVQSCVGYRAARLGIANLCSLKFVVVLAVICILSVAVISVFVASEVETEQKLNGPENPVRDVVRQFSSGGGGIGPSDSGSLTGPTSSSSTSSNGGNTQISSSQAVGSSSAQTSFSTTASPSSTGKRNSFIRSSSEGKRAATRDSNALFAITGIQKTNSNTNSDSPIAASPSTTAQTGPINSGTSSTSVVSSPSQFGSQSPPTNPTLTTVSSTASLQSSPFPSIATSKSERSFLIMNINRIVCYRFIIAIIYFVSTKFY
jgi:hypothetical protein